MNKLLAFLAVFSAMAPITSSFAEEGSRKANCHFEVRLQTLNLVIGEGDKHNIGYGLADCVSSTGVREKVGFYVTERITDGIWAEALLTAVAGDAEMDAEDVLGKFESWDLDYNTDGISFAWLGLESKDENVPDINLVGVSVGVAAGFKKMKVKFVGAPADEIEALLKSNDQPDWAKDVFNHGGN